MTLTADAIKEMLGLEPHPTCGFAALTYQSALQLPGAVLPAGYGGARPLGAVLYFLVTPDARMRVHRLRSDQMYHHYLGDPLDVLLLHPDGRGEVAVAGTDLAAGMRPQLLIPGGTFHVSRVRPGGSYALMGTSAWPGGEAPDIELGDPAALMTAYPALAADIRAFTDPAAGAHAPASDAPPDPE